MSLFAALTGLGIFMLASIWLWLKYYFTNQRVFALENEVQLIKINQQSIYEQSRAEMVAMDNRIQVLERDVDFLNKQSIPDAYETGVKEGWELHKKGLQLRYGQEGTWVVNKAGDPIGLVLNDRIEYFQQAAHNFQ